ncbi:MAG TPA: Hsp20/alpha crystallin family protein, partial [Caulobacteraceae bacterium]|nr:Hsp20/alpha crystallin family protein [Caulobacteraceae bacterium]
LDPLAEMQMEMNRWFDEAVRHMAGFGFFPPLLAARPFAGASPAPLFGLPPTDVKETKDAYVLAVELPGLAREDVEVALDGDRITLCGHKAEDRAEATASYRISERRFGHFERSFPIPDDVARSEIEAAFKDGLLKITLPRQEAASAKRSRIEIHG